MTFDPTKKTPRGLGGREDPGAGADPGGGWKTLGAGEEPLGRGPEAARENLQSVSRFTALGQNRASKK